MKTLLRLLVLAGIALAACTPMRNDNYRPVQRIDALDDAAWDTSIWISVADAPVVTGRIGGDNELAADGQNWFVTELDNEKEVTSAKWMTTGLGVYELYVNGHNIGREVLKPGFTHYAKTKYSFTYDVTGVYKTRQEAHNQLAASVTPGWWGDKIVTPSGHEGMIGKKCAFRGVLELTYADGSTRLYGTNLTDWKAAIAGPVTHAGIFDGEYYDARLTIGHMFPMKYPAPVENTEFQGEILPSNGAEVYQRADLTLAPVRAYVWKEIEGAGEGAFGKVVIDREYAHGENMVVRPGETLVVDFGQNAAAVPSFVFKAEDSTVLTCLPGELLNDGNGALSRGMDGPEGSVHRTNLRMHETAIRIQYTFVGTRALDSPGYDLEWSNYTPSTTFFGYRYLSITATDDVEIARVVSVPVTSIAKEMETGRITTGDELINKLISNTVWGQRSNYLSVPTDCPQRNERLGWTADTQVFSETGTFFANTDRFFHKWMRDMRDSQSETGGFPGVAPLAQYGEDMMRLGWADAGVIVPWTVWKQFGDVDIIEENWAAMDKFMQHVNATRYDHKALVAENGNYQWADWLSYEPLESHGGSAFTTNAAGRRSALPDAITYWSYLGACYWAMDAEMMRDMAAATGRDAASYQAMADAARDYLKQTFLDGKGGFKTPIFNTMQTPALFALRCGLVEGEAKDALIARLRANFAAHGSCLQTGFLGTSILMQTLTDNGMSDIAWDLLFQRKNPSWLYSIDNGATTIWERWNSYTLEHGMGPKGMNSFNHYAYGCVCQWIWETAAGIAADPADPGFKHIVMAPVPDKRLGSLEAEYASAAGPVKSAWHYEGDRWIWEFSIPEGATASVTLPGEQEAKEYGPGTYKVEK